MSCQNERKKEFALFTTHAVGIEYERKQTELDKLRIWVKSRIAKSNEILTHTEYATNNKKNWRN